LANFAEIVIEKISNFGTGCSIGIKSYCNYQ